MFVLFRLPLQLLGANHPDVAKQYTNLAILSSHLGKYDEVCVWVGGVYVRVHVCACMCAHLCCACNHLHTVSDVNIDMIV